jgi:DNA-binding transcriptional ArsR family regulator
MCFLLIVRSDRAYLSTMEEALRAIAQPHRREIVRLVRSEELTAGQIASHFEVSRPAVSQHLKSLKDAGLVTERRQGTRRFYRAQAENLAALRTFLDVFLGDETTVTTQATQPPQAV